jgi:hypothetical protein
MSFPFDHFVEDENVPPNTLYILNPRYKLVQSPDDPRVLEERLDVEATAKASLVIKNLGV